MPQKLIEVRLDKLNIPAETLRNTSSPAAMKALKESIEQHGIIVPIIIRALGKGEYDVWDGTRRVTALKELGKPGSTLIPALVTDGDDSDSLITQVNINQTRERLTNLAEATALRNLVEDHGLKQVEAARLLLKTKSWASKVIRVWSLPKPILKDIQGGKLPLSHAMVLSRYLNDPEILQMLYKESLKGKLTFAHLGALGKLAKAQGVHKAKNARPQKIIVGKKSWVRIEPLQKGKRFELHLDDDDSPERASTEIARIVKAEYAVKKRKS